MHSGAFFCSIHFAAMLTGSAKGGTARWAPGTQGRRCMPGRPEPGSDQATRPGAMAAIKGRAIAAAAAKATAKPTAAVAAVAAKGKPTGALAGSAPDLSEGDIRTAAAFRVKYRVLTDAGKLKRRLAIRLLGVHPYVYPQGDVCKQLGGQPCQKRIPSRGG